MSTLERLKGAKKEFRGQKVALMTYYRSQCFKGAKKEFRWSKMFSKCIMIFL